MWTHEMPLNRPVRQAREQLYLSRASEIQASLKILARSSREPLRLFGERWLEDYRRWAEDRGQAQKPAA